MTSALSTVDTVLPEGEWRDRRAHHEARVRPWVEPRQERRKSGAKHPTDDFLFEYYPYSVGKLDELREFWGKDSVKRVVPIKGDLGSPKLGVSPADVRKLKGKVKHFYHLGAVYDLEASAEAMEKANIAGTRGALEFAEAVNAGCFHLVSSIAAAGLYALRHNLTRLADDHRRARRLRAGAQRHEVCHVRRHVRNGGVLVAFGSDAPVTDLGPWAAVRHHLCPALWQPQPGL